MKRIALISALVLSVLMAKEQKLDQQRQAPSALIDRWCKQLAMPTRELVTLHSGEEVCVTCFMADKNLGDLFNGAECRKRGWREWRTHAMEPKGCVEAKLKLSLYLLCRGKKEFVSRIRELLADAGDSRLACLFRGIYYYDVYQRKFKEKPSDRKTIELGDRVADNLEIAAAVGEPRLSLWPLASYWYTRFCYEHGETVGCGYQIESDVVRLCRALAKDGSVPKAAAYADMLERKTDSAGNDDTRIDWLKIVMKPGA